MNAKSLVSTIIAALALALAGAGLSPAGAQDMHTPGIDHAQAQIRLRIEQGIASGRITPREADALYQRERELQAREMRMKRDGHASPGERQALRQDMESMRADVERAIARHSAVASHSDHRPGVLDSHAHIRARIDQGIRSGHLTPREAGRLRMQERDLYRLEAQFNADGYLSRGERRQLREELAMLDRDIDRLMGNQRYR